MRTPMLALSIAACLSAYAQDAKKYRLVFEPKKGEALRVLYSIEQKWDYKDDDMKGSLRTELALAWRFDDKDGKLTGTATLDRVAYRAKGVKKGQEFDEDLEWTSKDGYLRGKDSDADKRWCAVEIKEGVQLNVDERATCEEGAC